MAYPCLLLGTIGSANYVREEAEDVSLLLVRSGPT